MINHHDNILRDLFLNNIASLADEAQIRFQPPDADWRTYVNSFHQTALNVYLVGP